MIKNFVYRSLAQLTSSRYNRIAVSMNVEAETGGYWLPQWLDRSHHVGLMGEISARGPQSLGDIAWVPNGVGGTYVMYDHSYSSNESADDSAPQCLDKIWKHVLADDARGEIWVPMIWARAQQGPRSFGSMARGLSVIAEADGDFNVFTRWVLDAYGDAVRYDFDDIDTDEPLEDVGFEEAHDKDNRW